jgi:hypothetical protein
VSQRATPKARVGAVEEDEVGPVAQLQEGFGLPVTDSKMVDDQGDKNPAQDGTSANFDSGAGYNRTRSLKHPRRRSVRRAASFTPSQLISATRPVWTGVVGRPYQSSRIGTVPLVMTVRKT